MSESKPESKVKVIDPNSPDEVKRRQAIRDKINIHPIRIRPNIDSSHAEASKLSHDLAPDGRIRIRRTLDQPVVSPPPLKIENKLAITFVEARKIYETHIKDGQAVFDSQNKVFLEELRFDVAESLFRQWAQTLIYEKRNAFITQANEWLNAQKKNRPQSEENWGSSLPQLTLKDVLRKGSTLYTEIQNKPLMSPVDGQPIHLITGTEIVQTNSDRYLLTIEAVKKFKELEKNPERSVKVTALDGKEYEVKVMLKIPATAAEKGTVIDSHVPLVYPAETVVESNGVKYLSKAPVIHIITHGNVNKNYKHTTFVTQTSNGERVEVETQKLTQAVNTLLQSHDLPNITILLSCDPTLKSDGSQRGIRTRWDRAVDQGNQARVLGFSGNLNLAEDPVSGSLESSKYGTTTEIVQPDTWIEYIADDPYGGRAKLRHAFQKGTTLFPLVEGLFTQEDDVV